MGKLNLQLLLSYIKFFYFSSLIIPLISTIFPYPTKPHSSLLLHETTSNMLTYNKISPSLYYYKRLTEVIQLPRFFILPGQKLTKLYRKLFMQGKKFAKAPRNLTTAPEKFAKPVDKLDRALDKSTKVLDKSAKALDKSAKLLDKFTKALDKLDKVLDKFTKALVKDDKRNSSRVMPPCKLISETAILIHCYMLHNMDYGKLFWQGITLILYGNKIYLVSFTII